MSSFNKITIVGYLGKDPELRYTPQGTPVCNVSIATTEKRKDAYGEQKDVTTWFRLTLWRRQAELAHQYLSKGSQIYVEGRLREEKYTDREGIEKSSIQVDVTEMQFIGSRETSEEAPRREEQSAPPPSSRQSSRTTSRQEKQDDRPYDDDIPF